MATTKSKKKIPNQREEKRTANIQSLVEPSLKEKFIEYLSELPPGQHRRPSDFLRAKIIGLLQEAKKIPTGKYL